MPLNGVYPNEVVGARFEQTDTTSLFPGGTICTDNLGGIWKYGQATAAIAQYNLCFGTGSSSPAPVFTSATAALLTTTTSYFIGIAQVAFAINEYGWFWCGIGGGVGRGIKVNVSASTAANVKLFGTVTAGQVSATVLAPLIQGLQLTVLTASGAGEVYSSTELMINAQD